VTGNRRKKTYISRADSAEGYRGTRKTVVSKTRGEGKRGGRDTLKKAPKLAQFAYFCVIFDCPRPKAVPSRKSNTRRGENLWDEKKERGTEGETVSKDTTRDRSVGARQNICGEEIIKGGGEGHMLKTKGLRKKRAGLKRYEKRRRVDNRGGTDRIMGADTPKRSTEEGELKEKRPDGPHRHHSRESRCRHDPM